jgi:hypothetical protein
MTQNTILYLRDILDNIRLPRSSSAVSRLRNFRQTTRPPTPFCGAWR